MATYIITEKQNFASKREGEEINAASLSVAKGLASKMQMFQGTMLTVEDDSGRLLAVKSNGKWINTRN